MDPAPVEGRIGPQESYGVRRASLDGWETACNRREVPAIAGLPAGRAAGGEGCGRAEGAHLALAVHGGLLVHDDGDVEPTGLAGEPPCERVRAPVRVASG